VQFAGAAVVVKSGVGTVGGAVTDTHPALLHYSAMTKHVVRT